MSVPILKPQLDPDRIRQAAQAEAGRRWLLVFLKLTFPGYQVDPVHAFLAQKLQHFVKAVELEQSPRLMLFLPPQHGKSELVSRRLPPWVLGNYPDWSIILASYGADLAEDLSGDARKIVMSSEFAAIFGSAATTIPEEAVAIERARKTVSDWRLEGHRGGMRAVGVAGAITGRPAHILIVDDPVKGRLEVDRETYRRDQKTWWPQARDRVQKGGGILVTCTRWHEDDLPGYLLKLAEDRPEGDQWEVINLQALAPEEGPPDVLIRAPGAALAPTRFDVAHLLKIKATIPNREWQAKFCGRPSPQEGAIFRREYWRFEPAERANPLAIYQFWDTAFSTKREADFSACTTWSHEAGGVFRLLDAYWARLGFPDLKRTAVRLFHSQTKRPRAVVVERKGREDAVYEEFKRDTGLPLIWFNPEGDKVARAHAVTPLIEGGRVILPDRASWLDEYLDEMTRFPHGEHDDLVDSTTMALICLGVRGMARRGRMSLIDFEVVAG